MKKIPCIGRYPFSFRNGKAVKIRKEEAPPVLRTILGSLRPLETAVVKWKMASEIKQAIGSSETSDSNLDKQSLKGATHLMLSNETRAIISSVEASVSVNSS